MTASEPRSDILNLSYINLDKYDGVSYITKWRNDVTYFYVWLKINAIYDNW